MILESIIILYHLDKGLAVILWKPAVAQMHPRRHDSISVVSAWGIVTVSAAHVANPNLLIETGGCFRACSIPSAPCYGTAALLLPSDVSRSL